MEQEDTGPDQQDLEEAHFHYILSSFEGLLKQYDPDLVTMSLSFDSIQKLEKSIKEMVQF